MLDQKKIFGDVIQDLMKNLSKDKSSKVAKITIIKKKPVGEEVMPEADKEQSLKCPVCGTELVDNSCPNGHGKWVGQEETSEENESTEEEY